METNTPVSKLLEQILKIFLYLEIGNPAAEGTGYFSNLSRFYFSTFDKKILNMLGTKGPHEW